MASRFGGNAMGMHPQQNLAAAALQQALITQIQQNVGHLTGWQAAVNVGERFNHVSQLVSQLRLVDQGQHDLQQICSMALEFEKGTFDTALDKEIYIKAIRDKMEHLTSARMQMGVNTQAQLHARAQAQRLAQAQQMNMVNQGNVQGQLQRTGMSQPAQQPFHHLEQQMQASPLSGPQQPLQVPMGMANQQQQHPFQINLQQQQQQHHQHQLRQQQQAQQQAQQPSEKRSQPNINNFPLSPQDQAAVNNMVQVMLQRMPEEERQAKRNQIRAQMDPAVLAKYTAPNIDLLLISLRSQAMQAVRQKKMQTFNEMQLQQVRARPGLANAPLSTPMQQQRSGNPTIMNAQSAQPSQMAMNPDFGSFAGNVGDMMGQQPDGGPMASGPQGNGAPPGMQGLPGGPMDVNGQRPPSNPNMRAQPSQQAFNAEQAQAQAQTRASASATAAQQMGLQGQPGGMGPMPPSQSPAMTTLNAPLRTPQQPQPAHPADPLQINQLNLSQFGAPLDGRYTQANQQRNNAGGAMNGLNGPFPVEMSQEIRQKIMALPKDKLNEVVGKWNASYNGQAGKPPAMNVPGARPNPQANQTGHQFNRPGMPNQFSNGNPGGQQQLSQTPMMTHLNAQQQQALMRTKMGPQPGRGPNGQAAMTAQDQAISQIDHLDFPAQIKAQNPLLRHVPEHLTRWGELKQWVSQSNLAMQGNTLESLKELQRLHFTSLVRAKNIVQERQRAVALSGGTSMGPQQPGPPVPGMAPVAPMGQPPQIPGAMSAPQISMEDIQRARSQNSRWANASDDEIKQIIVKNHYSSRQRELHLHNQMEAAHKAQLQPPSGNTPGPQRTPQQPPQRPPHPHQPPKPGGRPQPMAPPAGSNETPNPARAPRPGPPAKLMPPTSSAPPPKNNLKRASSDEIVEVPNSNGPPPARSTAPSTGNQPKTIPAGRAPPTANLPTSWTAEQRQQYAAATARNQGQGQPPQPLRGNPADVQRFSAIVQEEMSRLMPLPPIAMTPEVMHTINQRLSTITPKFKMVKMSLPKWFTISKDEDRLRKFLRMYYMLSLQFQGPDMTAPLKEQFSITPAQIDQAYSLASSLVTDLSVKFPKLSKSANGVGGAGPAQNPSRPVTHPESLPAAPLNAANLQEQQRALKFNQGRIPSRGNNRSNAPPPPPTSAHPPPFPPDAFASPLTVDQLRLPKSKKQRVSASSTPVLGQQSLSTTTARSAKQGLHEDKPPQSSEPTEPKRKGFFCPEQHCDHHFLDEFPDAEALERHREEEHVRPVQDPKKYALDHLALITRVDQDGKPQPSRPAPSLKPTSVSQVKSAPANTVSTPMNRQRSTHGAQASPSSPKAAKSPRSNDITVATTTNGDPDFTDLTMAFDDDLWGGSAVNPQELLHNFQSMEAGAGGAISDMSVYRSITPNDTPESSKDGLSEPTSDISEGFDLNINLDFADQNKDWKPFGLSDMEPLLDLDAMYVNSLDDEMAGVIDAGYLDADSSQFVPWNDFVDSSAFDKPFSIDQTFFSLSAE